MKAVAVSRWEKTTELWVKLLYNIECFSNCNLFYLYKKASSSFKHLNLTLMTGAKRIIPLRRSDSESTPCRKWIRHAVCFRLQLKIMMSWWNFGRMMESGLKIIFRQMKNAVLINFFTPECSDRVKAQPRNTPGFTYFCRTNSSMMIFFTSPNSLCFSLLH